MPRLLCDPSRTGVPRCPTCRDRMRPFFRRLICDRCEGMFIDIDDFADAIGAMEPVEVLDEGPAARACPRCRESMRAGRLAIGKLLFDGLVVYCGDHGLWFGEASFAEV